MAKRQHNHHIDVQTDEELVTVTIGTDGGVPGGFAKLFNRVVDSEAWAQLPDAARAVYIPMVRFSDHRNQFRTQIGQAALMKYSGLSRSSIKRALRDLVKYRLVAIVERGGVSEIGQNETNVYQLLVPGAVRRRSMSAEVENPPGGRERTLPPASGKPTPGPLLNPQAGRCRPHAGDEWTGEGKATADPQYRIHNKETNNRASRLEAIAAPEKNDAAALLEKNGVEPAVARKLAEAFDHQRIVDVIATMEWRLARGKCDNPGGFIHDALTRQWQTPKPVLDARARAEARLRAEATERQSRSQAAREIASASQEESRVERLLAALDDDELEILSESVLLKYQGNPAVSAVLTRKPPRECRLMKMEIAAMLEGARDAG